MTDNLTPERITELRALEKAATPRPWRTTLCDDTVVSTQSGHYEIASTSFGADADTYNLNHETMEADAALIAALRNAAPALLDAAEALAKAQARIAELEAGLERIGVGGNHLATYSQDWPAWELDGLTRSQQCENALRMMGAGKDYDMWCCWSAMMQVRAELDPDRGCTCHPDDKPPRPCPRKYAYNECSRAARLLNQE